MFEVYLDEVIPNCYIEKAETFDFNDICRIAMTYEFKTIIYVSIMTKREYHIFIK